MLRMECRQNAVAGREFSGEMAEKLKRVEYPRASENQQHVF